MILIAGTYPHCCNRSGVASEGSQTHACSNVPLIKYRVTISEKMSMLPWNKTSGAEEMWYIIECWGLQAMMVQLHTLDQFVLVNQTLNYAGQSTSITQFYSMEDISPFLDSLWTFHTLYDKCREKARRGRTVFWPSCSKYSATTDRECTEIDPICCLPLHKRTVRVV